PATGGEPSVYTKGSRLAKERANWKWIYASSSGTEGSPSARSRTAAIEAAASTRTPKMSGRYLAATHLSLRARPLKLSSLSQLRAHDTTQSIRARPASARRGARPGSLGRGCRRACRNRDRPGARSVRAGAFDCRARNAPDWLRDQAQVGNTGRRAPARKGARQDRKSTRLN